MRPYKEGEKQHDNIPTNCDHIWVLASICISISYVRRIVRAVYQQSLITSCSIARGMIPGFFIVLLLLPYFNCLKIWRYERLFKALRYYLSWSCFGVVRGKNKRVIIDFRYFVPCFKYDYQLTATNIECILLHSQQIRQLASWFYVCIQCPGACSGCLAITAFHGMRIVLAATIPIM